MAEHRGGLFTMTPDGRFVIGPVPDPPGLWVASGCNGSGFSSALALGEVLAVDQRHAPAGLESQRWRRDGSAPLTDEAP